MSKLIKDYRAIQREDPVVEAESKDINIREGILGIYESQYLHPGEHYIVFQADKDVGYRLQTSCGEIQIEANILTISTMNGNTYSFQIIKEIQRILYQIQEPERFLHVCCACGKRQILSSVEAFAQGWDYPGQNGIYRDLPNYGFCLFGPRTCGSCKITESVYWKVLTGQVLSDRDMQTIERIKNEPMSLIVEDNQDKINMFMN